MATKTKMMVVAFLDANNHNSGILKENIVFIPIVLKDYILINNNSSV